MSDDALGPGLYWSIKRAFVLYVARIADGQILGSRGLSMTDASTFRWPPATSPSQEVDGVIRLAFEGAVTFGAHGGALAFHVADPWLVLTSDRSRMTIAGEGSARIPFVHFTASEGDGTTGTSVWAGTDVRLSEEALPLFAGYYGADAPFDDLRIVVSSSASGASTSG